ncbi:DUF4145 domain-containing protein [Dapis sp. BLCC M229]|uniref:DUF4145 domain-containing protein n=1 Tax=Dapis sp. BLCC M229 TaxID=3400188 RepID=UPI003CEDD697
MICEKDFSYSESDDSWPDFYVVYTYKLFSCPSCSKITIICYSETLCTEEDKQERYYRLERGDYGRKVIFMPPRKEHPAIPESIAEITYQAQLNLAASPRASFILCRAVLEEICHHFKIPVKAEGKSYPASLAFRLNQLFEQEKMPEDLREIIQGVRQLGNEGAHSEHLTFTKQVNMEEADNLLKIVNYVIEKLFVDKYEQQKAEKVLEELKIKILKSE